SASSRRSSTAQAFTVGAAHTGSPLSFLPPSGSGKPKPEECGDAHILTVLTLTLKNVAMAAQSSSSPLAILSSSGSTTLVLQTGAAAHLRPWRGSGLPSGPSLPTFL